MKIHEALAAASNAPDDEDELAALRQLAEAARDVDDALSEIPWSEIAEHFSCHEVDALVFALDSLGFGTESLMDAHAEDDDDGDDHPGWTPKAR